MLDLCIRAYTVDPIAFISKWSPFCYSFRTIHLFHAGTALTRSASAFSSSDSFSLVRKELRAHEGRGVAKGVPFELEIGEGKEGYMAETYHGLRIDVT